MSVSMAEAGLIDQARLYFAELFVRDVQPLLDVALESARLLNEKPAERAVAQQRRDMTQDLMRHGANWPALLGEQVRERLAPREALSSQSSALVSSMTGGKELALVDDDTIQREIMVSRLSLAIMDRSSWEFSDLRARLMQVTRQADLADEDIFRAQILGRSIIRAWVAAGLSLDTWRGLEEPMHKACARHAEEVYHETNRWLIEHGVMPEVDLRPFIRRSDGSPTGPAPLDDEESAAGPTTQAAQAAQATQAARLSGAASLPGLSHPRGGQPGAGQDGGGAAGGDTVRAPVGGGASGHGGHGGATNRGAGSGGGGSGGGGQAQGAAGGGWSGGGGYGGSGGHDGGDGFTGAGRGGAGQHPSQAGHVGRGGGHASSGNAQGARSGPASGADARHTGPYSGGMDEETRLMTRQSAGGSGRADVVLEQFSDMMERHLPGFKDTNNAQPPSARLSSAMAQAQQRLVEQIEQPAPGEGGGPAAMPTPSALMRDLRERQVVLKQAAATPAEHATIELVALLFQSILTEDRIPAALRVWFARLQMPTLRVAIAEPDFFSTTEHPARRLIDRMGACVMGFEGDNEPVGGALEAEVKRVVQVVEAFPDTGRRVFQTVLNEFEKFLESYFREHNETTRVGVSLAQQVEQRETLAIQYTIELRRMLNEVPVQEGVREFLFHIWADVLATTAVRHGTQGNEVKTVRDAATELMWTASAKTTREERAEVIRRLPPLLATLRKGMGTAGMAAPRQEEAIRALNLALTAAFGARAVTITPQQLDQLKRRLEAIEEVLPDDDFEIDDAWVMDESSHAQEGLEIVSEGGSMPGPAMLEWASQLQVGSAYMLEYRGRRESVRLAWQGMHKQLLLFVAAGGRCVLFQKARLAAFLQAGLLVPAQDESLTVAATRSAIHKINADPARLLH